MSNKVISWILFCILSVVWGSSFMLIKIGLGTDTPTLNAFQVAAIRTGSAGMVLLPFLPQALKNIPRNRIGYAVASGILGSFLPSFLFCIAETKIDAALTGILNALTPFFTVIIGVIFLKQTASWQKWLGISIGFAGLVLLPFSSGEVISFTQLSYALLVLLATIFYGINVNMVAAKMHSVAAIHIATVGLCACLVPSIIVLSYWQINHPIVATKAYGISVGAGMLLGVLGTAIATILFYTLVKKAGGLFASLVTYGIPFVAIGWGIFFGEKITALQVLCLLIILAGVFITNKKAA